MSKENSGAKNRSKSPKKSFAARRRSTGSKSTSTFENLEHEIRQLELKSQEQLEKKSMFTPPLLVNSGESLENNEILNNNTFLPLNNINSKTTGINIDKMLFNPQHRSINFDRLNQIGKLDPKIIELNRSSTPDENNQIKSNEQSILLRHYEFKLNK